jgi:hypothetical protein
MTLSVLEIAGHIADLKDTDYRNTLAAAVLVELLVEKGVFTREEFALKARELEQATLAETIAARRRRLLGK